MLAMRVGHDKRIGVFVGNDGGVAREHVLKVLQQLDWIQTADGNDFRDDGGLSWKWC